MIGRSRVVIGPLSEIDRCIHPASFRKFVAKLPEFIGLVMSFCHIKTNAERLSFSLNLTNSLLVLLNCFEIVQMVFFGLIQLGLLLRQLLLFLFSSIAGSDLSS